jgi:hypothetical protein
VVVNDNDFGLIMQVSDPSNPGQPEIGKYRMHPGRLFTYGDKPAQPN